MASADFISKKVLWRSIREYCLDCCGGGTREVRFCTIPKCALYPHRFGRKPALDDYTFLEGDARYPSKEMQVIHQKRLQEREESKALG